MRLRPAERSAFEQVASAEARALCGALGDDQRGLCDPSKSAAREASGEVMNARQGEARSEERKYEIIINETCNALIKPLAL